MEYSGRQIATKNTKTIKAEAGLSEALDLLHKTRLSHLLVTETQGKPVGIITEQSIMRFHFNGNRVGDLATCPTAKVSPSDTLVDLCELMIDRKITSVAVVENNRFVGVIGFEDILRLLIHVLSKQNLSQSSLPAIEWLPYEISIGQIFNFLSGAGI